MRYVYPFTLEPDETGELIVEFPDVPGALTSGAAAAEAKALAEDCLIAALGGYIERRRPIPAPSQGGRPSSCRRWSRPSWRSTRRCVRPG